MKSILNQIDGRTTTVGIIGYPVEHSLSPLIHNAAFQILGLNNVYVPLPVKPGQLGNAIKGLIGLGFVGANVTAPYKEELIDHLDAIDPVSESLRAVNTLVISRDTSTAIIKGYNTDVQGFIEGARSNGYNLADASLALVVGAGGAARAVVYALLHVGIKKIVILNRNPQRATLLVQTLCPNSDEAKCIEIQPLTSDNLSDWAKRADLLVNTTPLGTWPRVNETIWPVEKPFPHHLVVYDLVYNPEKTMLIKQAAQAGAPAIGGIMMLIHQAALAFQLWTGVSAPVSTMSTVAKEVLKKLSDAAETSDKN